MKRFLQISLVLNAVLAAAVVWRHTRETPLLRPLRMDISESGQKRHRPAAAPSVGGAPSPASPWNAIEDSDPRQFIARLRAIGCPEQTIRDIVTLRVCRQFRERLLEIETEAARSRNYTHQENQKNWRDRTRRQLDLRDEMISTLESLFDEPWQKLAGSVQNFPAMWQADALKSLSIEARRKIREVDAQFRQTPMDSLTQDWHTGGLDSEGRTQLRELERQKRAALAAVLSPEELDEYLYRKSPAADFVRSNLPEAKSEAEYRAMVKLALEMGMSETLDSLLAERRLPENWDSTDVKKEVAERKRAFDEQLKAVLGETRVAEQKTEQSNRERDAKQRAEAQDEKRIRDQLGAMATEVGVEPAAANRFYDRVEELKSTMNAKFEEMEKSLTGTPEEKQKQMEVAAKAEFEKVAVEIMGDKGLAFVKRVMENPPE